MSVAIHTMKRPKKEYFKTIILVFLFILSVAQIGIHLNQQTQWFPFSFLSGLFPAGNNSPQLNLDSQKNNYFIPEDVIVSKNLFTQWSLGQDESDYQKIWSDVRDNYLPAISRSKPDKIMAKADWQNLMSESLIRIDFYVNYPKSMLRWFIGPGADKQSFNGIKSIAVLPQKNVNETINTVYIYDENAVYKYSVEIEGMMQPKAYYQALSDTLTADGYRPMTAISQAFPQIKTEEGNANFPIYSYPDTTKSYQTINIKIPNSIALPASDNLHSMQESILLKQKDSLVGYYDSKNANAVFSDTDNVYTVDSHGILQYKYVPQVKPESGDVKTAFINAASFIELRRALVGDADIVLTGENKSDRNDGSYVFTFDYMFDGNKIIVTDVKNNGNQPVPAITITATNTRVLECNWVIREITGNNDPKNYKISLVELTDRMSMKNPNLLNGLLSTVYLEDVQTGYYFDARVDSENPCPPIWLIKTKSSGKEEYYQTLLPEEGGN